MKETVRSMSSNVHFPFESVFDISLPPTPEVLKTPLQKLRVASAVRRQKEKNRPSSNLFIDCGTSLQRGCEFAQEVSTCIRPTHQVWSTRLGRHVTVPELWNCQGLWAQDWPEASAVLSMLERPKEAQDLCGNSFSSTVSQSKLLASLAHSAGWKTIADHHHQLAAPCEKTVSEAVQAANIQQHGMQGSEQADTIRRRIKGKRKAAELPGYADLPFIPPKVENVKRRRGRPRKDSPPRVPRGGHPKPKKPIRSQANKKTRGKQGSLSIWTKVQLLNESFLDIKRFSCVVSFMCVNIYIYTCSLQELHMS